MAGKYCDAFHRLKKLIQERASPLFSEKPVYKVLMISEMSLSFLPSIRARFRSQKPLDTLYNPNFLPVTKISKSNPIPTSVFTSRGGSPLRPSGRLPYCPGETTSNPKHRPPVPTSSPAFQATGTSFQVQNQAASIQTLLIRPFPYVVKWGSLEESCRIHLSQPDQLWDYIPKTLLYTPDL